VGQAGAASAGSTGLHALKLDKCDSSASCNLECSAGEKLVSVTCPGGTIAFSKTADGEAATCSSSPGPALALCIRQ
jgi:hypothetical protein